MTNRFYRGVLGLLLLTSLYFNWSMIMYGIIVMLFLEGISNVLVPDIVNVARQKLGVPMVHTQGINACLMPNGLSHLGNERIWRLVVGGMLLLTYSNIDVLWFFPWFMGFAIFGAGLSGICPVLLFIQWANRK